jgi:RNA polymerase sigma-70 factor (ECF subfamily)
MDDDLRLVERYIAGDADAIEDIVRKYQKQIYAVLYRMTGNTEDAKDLTQTAFVKAMEAMKGFRRESSLKTWLYQIAINTGLNHLRLRQRRETELDESVAGDHGGTLAGIIERERRGSLRKGLNELPARQRLAVILRAYEGLSCAETAQVMGCTEGAVKAHYHHAVKRLREILKEKGYEVRS